MCTVIAVCGGDGAGSAAARPTPTTAPPEPSPAACQSSRDCTTKRRRSASAGSAAMIPARTAGAILRALRACVSPARHHSDGCRSSPPGCDSPQNAKKPSGVSGGPFRWARRPVPVREGKKLGRVNGLVRSVLPEGVTSSSWRSPSSSQEPSSWPSTPPSLQVPSSWLQACEPPQLSLGWSAETVLAPLITGTVLISHPPPIRREYRKSPAQPSTAEMPFWKVFSKAKSVVLARRIPVLEWCWVWPGPPA